MAATFSVNNSPATGAVAMYELMQCLIASGWTVGQSSDGTTHSSSGNIITSGGSGTGGLNNNYAWFVITNSAGKMAWCWQARSSAISSNKASYWSTTISPSNSFSGGNATTIPTAPDGQSVFGLNPIFDADGSYYYNAWSDGLQFYSFSIQTSGGSVNHMMTSEQVTQNFDYSGSPTDVIRYFCNAFSTGTGNAAMYYNSVWDAGYSSGVGVSPLDLFANGNGFSPNLATGSDILQSIMWIDNTQSPQIFKGITTTIYEDAVYADGATRNTGDTTTLNTPNDGILVYINSVFNDDGAPLVFPWNGSTPLGGSLTAHACELMFKVPSSGGGYNTPANPFNAGLE